MQHYVRFQVCYILIWPLCTFWNDCHSISSNHLSPNKYITILLTILWLLCCILHACNLFIYNWRFEPLNLLHLLYIPQPQPSDNTSLFSISKSLFSFCFVCLFVWWISHISESMWYLIVLLASVQFSHSVVSDSL